jgi:phage-related protein
MDLSFLTDWLVQAISYFLNLFQNLLIKVINQLIVAVADFIKTVINLLPDTPVPPAPSLPSDSPSLLSYINWFIPVSGIIVALGILLSAWVSYMLVAPLLRWLKIIK